MGIIDFNKKINQKIVNKLDPLVPKAELMEGIERVLDDGEEIIDSVVGDGDGKKSTFKIVVRGVLVLTPKRVFFYYKKKRGEYGTEEYSLDKISSINFAITNLLGRKQCVVEIYSNNNVLKFVSFWEFEEVEAFVKNVKQHIEEYKKEKTPFSKNNLDVADQISKLAELRNKGILTEEEFTMQKRKLLGL